jgi:hypothetical protein
VSVGTGRAVTVSNIQLAGAAKGNYTAPATGSALGDINPKTLSVNITIASKPYDGTTTATITDATLAGIVGTEDVTVDYTTATAAFNNASVGNGKQVTVTGLMLGGIDKENYTLPISNAAAGNITAIGKLQSPNIGYADDILYMYPDIYSGTRVTLKVDGFSDATIYYKTWVHDYYSYPEMPNTSSNSIKSGEKVQITGNPGEEIWLFAYASQEGYEDSDIGNTMFWILPKPKLSVTGASASDKDYDGNESAVINSGTLSGIIIPTASDVSINASAVSGCFSDKDAGNDKTVSVSGYALTGADAEYYELLPPPTTFTADIRVKEVSVDNIVISSKVYDGSTAADISDITLSWKAAGDDVYVPIPAATAAFTDADFGNNKTVIVTGLELAGADAANYRLTSTTASTTGIILPTGTVAAPSVNRITDSLLAGTRVTLSTATVGATIHYTLDGSEPTNSDSAYTDPILITGTPGTVITVKAVALKTGMAGSAIMTKQYTIAEPGSLIITATPGNQKIALSWDAIPDTVTYSVYNSGNNYLGNGISVTDSVYGYTADGLINGTSNTFTVKALDAEARVTNSAQVSAIPRTTPGAPTNVTARAGNGQATISFTEPTDNGGDSITGYLVMSTPGNITATGTGTSIRVIGLSNGTTYTFTVCAINSAGNGTESLPSNAVTPNRPSRDNSDGDSNSGGTTVPSSSSAPTVNSSGNITTAPELDKNTGIAATKVDTPTLTTAFDRTEEKNDGKKTVGLGIPAVEGAKAYEITLPASVLSSNDTGWRLEIKTNIARVILKGSMLTPEAVAGVQNVSLTVAQADISGIDKEIRDQIGGRPVIQLSLKVDRNPYTWSNDTA